ncbi:hypothetical protein G6F54_013820 [Rhizopus delemar]|nr:hypothetical protein G6F54_013820 [Rhizopus delemar]
MVGAVGKLAASRLAIAADGDAGLAPGVLQLAAHGRAVTFIVGGAQFGIGFAVGGIHLLPQALRHAVGHVRPRGGGWAPAAPLAACCSPWRKPAAPVCTSSTARQPRPWRWPMPGAIPACRRRPGSRPADWPTPRSQGAGTW